MPRATSGAPTSVDVSVLTELREGGLAQVASDGDIYVTYHVTTQDNQVFNTTSYGYGGWGPGWGGYGRWGYGYYGGMGSVDSTTRSYTYTDGTLIIAAMPLAGGTARTHRAAERLGRPCLVVDPDEREAVDRVRRWIEAKRIAVVNVAGPRESEAAGIHRRARRVVDAILA